jgi:predicted RNA-binding protein with PIN domain
MPMLVDACNVLHVTGVLPPALAVGEPADLAALVLRSRYARDRVTLVCDGARPQVQTLSHTHGLTLHWTGSEPADRVIDRLLAQSSHARAHVVVSDDRAVQASARHHGAEVMTGERFLWQLAQDAQRRRGEPELRRDVHLDDASTRRWMDELGLSEDTP